MNTHKPADLEIQHAAAAIQLSVAMTQIFKPAELGNDFNTLLFDAWIRQGRSPEWIDTVINAMDDIEAIAFARAADATEWVLDVEWRE